MMIAPSMQAICTSAFESMPACPNSCCGRPCDTLELNLCKGDGTEEYWSYHLNAAEQEVLARKMEAFCQQQNGMSLHDFARQLQEEPRPSPQIQM